MEKIAATLPNNTFGVRDRSLMTLHFAIAGREHELAHLRVRDITEDPEDRGLIVDVRVSKVAPRTVAVSFGSRAHLCPVRSWRRWKAELGDVDPDSFAFRAVHNRWKTVLDSGIDPVTVGDILTRIGARAELDIRPTGHSPRRGLVTESSRAGNPAAVLERQGGWAPGSKVMRRYREDDEAFKENALHGGAVDVGDPHLTRIYGCVKEGDEPSDLRLQAEGDSKVVKFYVSAGGGSGRRRETRPGAIRARPLHAVHEPGRSTGGRARCIPAAGPRTDSDGS
ncbi:tyrosine-type recombinase/integrase [Streptomyces sp. R39]|uniref:Tyrosine-type recombinase/integrase n=1 Tax=Streptomyces sp. R39 TaxID=3238631 RepID=A0AB39R3A8_9ACTN